MMGRPHHKAVTTAAFSPLLGISAKKFSVLTSGNHVVAQRTAQRLGDKLALLKTPAAKTVLRLGVAAGGDADILRRHFPRASILHTDPFYPLLLQQKSWWPWSRQPRFAALASQLPIASNTVDFLWSHLHLPTITPGAAFDQTLRECYRVLVPGAVFLFSTFGSDTLRELREAWIHSEGEGAVHRVTSFPDLHDIGDMLSAHGFTGPVMEMEPLVLTFKDVPSLLTTLRQYTPGNLNPLRPRHLLTPKHWQRLMTWHGWQEGARLTVEVVFGHAWKIEEATPVHWHPRHSLSKNDK